MERRTPRKPTPERLRRRAIHYLERFSTSKAHLRFVLLRRAAREAKHHEIDMPDIEIVVDQMLDDFEHVGLLNDRLYAEQKFNSLIEKGNSPVLAGRKLQHKGVPASLIERLLAESEPDLNRQAAIALARRKRLGPWRRGPADPDAKRKELGVLARAGFSYSIAWAIVEAECFD